MNLLLDTHTFLWWSGQSTRLSATAVAICQDRANVLLLSLASVWEIQIKVQMGKLALPAPLAQILEEQRTTNQIELLAITLSHILALGDLPVPHKDPFDRMLASQARLEGLALLTHDPVFAKYPIQVIW